MIERLQTVIGLIGRTHILVTLDKSVCDHSDSELAYLLTANAKCVAAEDKANMLKLDTGLPLENAMLRKLARARFVLGTSYNGF